MNQEAFGIQKTVELDDKGRGQITISPEPDEIWNAGYSAEIECTSNAAISAIYADSLLIVDCHNSPGGGSCETDQMASDGRLVAGWSGAAPRSTGTLKVSGLTGKAP